MKCVSRGNSKSMVEYKCSKCAKQFDLSQRGCVPTDSRGLPDESKALCGGCRPKEGETPRKTNPAARSRPYRTQTGRIGREKSVLQPFKRAGMEYQINEKFVDVYGSKSLREFHKEAADYYEKKGK